MLSRYSGQNEIIDRLVGSGPAHPDLENMIGMFNNFLPLRINLKPESRFDEFLKSANQQIMICLRKPGLSLRLAD